MLREKKTLLIYVARCSADNNTNTKVHSQRAIDYVLSSLSLHLSFEDIVRKELMLSRWRDYLWTPPLVLLPRLHNSLQQKTAEI